MFQLLCMLILTNISPSSSQFSSQTDKFQLNTVLYQIIYRLKRWIKINSILSSKTWLTVFPQRKFESNHLKTSSQVWKRNQACPFSILSIWLYFYQKSAHKKYHFKFRNIFHKFQLGRCLTAKITECISRIENFCVEIAED